MAGLDIFFFLVWKTLEGWGYAFLFLYRVSWYFMQCRNWNVNLACHSQQPGSFHKNLKLLITRTQIEEHRSALVIGSRMEISIYEKDKNESDVR